MTEHNIKGEETGGYGDFQASGQLFGKLTHRKEEKKGAKFRGSEPGKNLLKKTGSCKTHRRGPHEGATDRKNRHKGQLPKPGTGKKTREDQKPQ